MAQGPIAERPRHVLAGHEDAVACLAVSTERDVVVSGAADGTLLFHTLRRGRWAHACKCFYAQIVHSRLVACLVAVCN